jgi:hypothetical protein
MTDLIAIPVSDIRACGLVSHATTEAARSGALRDDCVAWLPSSARALLPVMDALTRRWLERSRSPYVGEIEALASALALPGIWFLNGCYEWGCTALAREEDGAPWLARTLDWPFRGLGRRVEVVRMRGGPGDFLNVTWPGYVGVLTAMAPGRFAAAINQAPLWRRTRQAWLRPADIALNALRTWRIRHCPPDHLLRDVFETCRSFAEAKRRLETTPIARPVIFTLVGCAEGEHCVIERTEEGFASRSMGTAAANDWLRSAPPWEARVSSAHLLTRTYEEAAARNRARRDTLDEWPGRFAGSPLAWVAPPVLNTMTRIAVEMCPTSGTLRVAGYELEDGAELPQRATEIRELTAAFA